MSSAEKNRDVLLDHFRLQLSEIEMLSSMYPSSNEFQITLPSILADMNRFVDGEMMRIPNELDFILNLQIPDIKDTVEVNGAFPHLYPTEKPSISCRSNSLSRAQQKELNCAVKNYVDSLPEGELCMISLTNWLTENAVNYVSLNSSETSINETTTTDKDLMSRMWVYSHHIYNKFKRREIINIAQDLNLTGFSLPGKPGLICIEGTKKDCDEFLQSLKQMAWKKLSLVKEEVNAEDLNFRKFDCFQEISFKVKRGPCKEYHMDMGQFLKYLEEHSCAYAFNDLFGFEGRTSADK